MVISDDLYRNQGLRCGVSPLFDVPFGAFLKLSIELVIFWKAGRGSFSGFQDTCGSRNGLNRNGIAVVSGRELSGGIERLVGLCDL